MSSILDFQKKYQQKIDSLDLDLLISAVIKKTREFVLTHPEYKIPATHNLPADRQGLKLEIFIQRRIKNEPIAYILGQKEFYGLEFKVDKNTLIPRPETELIVENVLKLKPKNQTIIDIGTGSGNIIISLAKNLKGKNTFFATDISQKALAIARQNAKIHKLVNKISFLCGNLLTPLIRNSKFEIRNSIIVANLPYLSKKIYNSAPKDIKNYEPKSALLSKNNGLSHYKKLFKQIKMLRVMGYGLRAMGYGLWVFLEFSPEQKIPLKKAVKAAFPGCHLTFLKDLAGKFRVVKFEI